MPLTGRDFTSTELEYLNELAGSMGMEPLPGFKPAGQLPGLKSSWGEDFEDPAAAMPFFPTSELISQPNPGFTQSDISPSQRRAFKGAQTETDRLLHKLTQEGRLAEAAQAVGETKPSVFQTAFQGISDVLQIGQFTTVGIVDEYIKTEDWGKAIEQGGTEFINALPGIELEGARRPGWSDVLKQTEVFGGSTTGRYTAAGLGFLMDVMLDPTTYTGFGTVKLLNAARKAGGAPALIDSLARRGVPLSQGFGEKFIPHFLVKQYGVRAGKEAQELLGKEGPEIVQSYLNKKAGFFAEVDQGYVQVQEVAASLAANMTTDQRIMFTLFLDQGDEKFKAIIKSHLMEKGVSDRYDEVIEKADEFRDAWAKFADDEVGAGALSQSVVREWDKYAPARDPLTKGSVRAWKEFISGKNSDDYMNLDDIRRIDPDAANKFAENTGLLGTDVPTFARSKVYNNIIERVVAGHPVELDVVKATTKRGMESVRAVATRGFVKSTLDDPTIVRKFDKAEGGALFKDAGKVAELERRGYAIMHPRTLKQYQKKELDEIGENGIWADLLADNPGAVIMPKPIYEDLVKMNRFMKDEDDMMQGFFKGFAAVQGIWKGYALLSPGYHLRNQYSNVFQNWLAGVTNPRRYAMSMALQAKGTANLPLVVREGVETLLGGRLGMDDTWITVAGKNWTGNDLSATINGKGIFNSGAFTKDLVTDIETHMLTSMERGIKKASFDHVAKGTEAFKRKLLATGIDEDQAEATTRIWDVAAKTWAIQNEKSVDDFWRQYGPEVRYSNADDFHPSGYTLYSKVGKEPPEVFRTAPLDAPDLPHGSVEDGLYEIFQNNPSPTADMLRKALGAPRRTFDLRRTKSREAKEELGEAIEGAYSETGIRHEPWSWDFRDLREILSYALKHGGNEYQWYKNFGKNVSEAVGEKNMAEFSGVYSITSARSDLESNFLHTIGIMRIAREMYQEFGEFNVKEFQTRLSRYTDVEKYNEARRAEGLPGLQKGEVVEIEGGRPLTLDREILDARKGNNLLDGTTTDRALGITKDMEKKIIELYKNAHFDGDMKTISFVLNNYQQAKGAGFFPFTVNDRHIARLFGIFNESRGEFMFDVGSKPGQDTYRWVQYQLAQLSKEHNSLISPDEVQAALWWYAKKYLSPAKDRAYSMVGGEKAWREQVGEAGSYASAATYAKAELMKLRAVQEQLGDSTGGLYRGLPGFEEMDVAYSKQARKVDEIIPLSAEAAQKRGERVIFTSSKAGLVTLQDEAIVRHGGFSLSEVEDAPWSKLKQFHNDFFNKVTNHDGTKIKALEELEPLLGFKHHINRDAVGTWNGLEPDYAITVQARDDATASGVAALVADGLKQDAVVWYRPQRFTANEAARMLEQAGEEVSSAQAIRFRRSDGGLFTEQELADLGAKLNPDKDPYGIQFSAEPGLGAARILNYSDVDDAVYFEPVVKLLKKEGHVTEHFTHVGAYFEKEDYAGFIGGIRGGVARGSTGTPDMARGIYDTLHKEYVETLRSHFGGSTGRQIYADELSQGVSAALQKGLVDPVAPPGTLLQKHGVVTKGAVEFNDEAKDIINIFEAGDFSTIVHESAHIFRRRLINADDMGVVEKWANIKDGKWGVRQEERFAKAFEQYLLEGRAPIEGLRGVFAKVKDWMTNLYQMFNPSTGKVPVRMNDDIRGVFDRLLGKGTLEPQPTGALGSEAAGAAKRAQELTGEPADIADRIQDVGGFLSRYFGQQSPLLRYNRAFGRLFENNARGAHFIDKLLKTGDEDVATASVNKYLFDYEHGLTDFERNVMRTVIPFYSWMRFNTPLQITAMLEDPARYAKIPKLIQNIEGITSEWRDTPTPDYFKELHAVRLPIIMNSKPVYLNPNLPFQDLNRMNFDDIVSSMTPFAKILGEWMPERGYSTFMDRPIERYAGEESEVVPGLRKKDENVLMTMVPTLGKIQRMIKAGKRDELSTQMLSEIAGLKLMNADPQRVLMSNTYAAREALRGLVKKLEAEGDIKPTRRRRRQRRGRRRRQRGGVSEVQQRLVGG